MFGEAEYESNETMKQNMGRLWRTGEACGYIVSLEQGKNGTRYIFLQGADLEYVYIFYNEDGSLDKIIKHQLTDRNGKEEMVSQERIVVND